MTNPKNDVSVEYVNIRLRYDHITGKLFWKPLPEDFNSRWKQYNGKHAGKEAGNITDQGYMNVYLDGRNYKAHRLAWLLHYGEWPPADLDHISGIRTENYIINLRLATRSENLFNMRTRRNGLKGVTISNGNWLARISSNGKTKHLGSFRSEQAAHNAYCKAAVTDHGSFARTI